MSAAIDLLNENEQLKSTLRALTAIVETIEAELRRAWAERDAERLAALGAAEATRRSCAAQLDARAGALESAAWPESDRRQPPPEGDVRWQQARILRDLAARLRDAGKDGQDV